MKMNNRRIAGTTLLQTRAGGVVASLFLFGSAAACTHGAHSATGEMAAAQTAAPVTCSGEAMTRCDFAGRHELDKAIALVLKNVQDHVAANPAPADSIEGAHVACAEVAYPGNEPTLLAETAKRGTFICLFNSQYTMNLALNRISTFVEDFETVDEKADYSDARWVEAQKTDGTLGHNLESPDIKRYQRETATHIQRRSRSDLRGIRLESEFLSGFVAPKMDAERGKPESILLGVPLPAAGGTTDAMEELKAVLGHEIFHSLYFHSAKMREIVQSYIDGLPQRDVDQMKRKLMIKGYDVVNDDGSPPSEKQVYMFYNETQAYLLESGACRDGAFMSYSDEDAEEPRHMIEKTAPLVVQYAGGLRQRLVDAGVIAKPWADQWSPDLVSAGCKAR
jgi:hypothetical protein